MSSSSCVLSYSYSARHSPLSVCVCVCVCVYVSVCVGVCGRKLKLVYCSNSPISHLTFSMRTYVMLCQSKKLSTGHNLSSKCPVTELLCFSENLK